MTVMRRPVVVFLGNNQPILRQCRRTFHGAVGSTRCCNNLSASTAASADRRALSAFLRDVVGCEQHAHKRTFSTTSSAGATTTGSIDTATTLTLYQYAICPFCNIVKSALNFHGVPHNAIEVNPLTKNELKFGDNDYKKVPILTIENDDAATQPQKQQVNGSEDIVDDILGRLGAPGGIGNNTLSVVSRDAKWESYARNELAPLLYPNICSSLPQAFQTMGYVHSVGNNKFSTMQKYSIQWIGSLAMYMAASRIKKKRQITDERQALFDALEEWEGHLKTEDENLSNLATRTVTMGDLSIHGVLHGLNGLPIHSDILANFPTIAKWYQLINESNKN